MFVTICDHNELKNKSTFEKIPSCGLFLTCRRKKYTPLYTRYTRLQDYWISFKRLLCDLGQLKLGQSRMSIISRHMFLVYILSHVSEHVSTQFGVEVPGHVYIGFPFSQLKHGPNMYTSDFKY
jgi:hypothetical protein